MSVSQLTMRYGDRILFQGASLTFSQRRRYGLVGANGAGKTTFLKILKGDIQPSGGRIQLPKEARVGMLDQEYFRFSDSTILDLVLMGDKELWKAICQKNALLNKESLGLSDTERLGDLEVLYERKGGYRAEAFATQLLEGLGIPESRHRDPLSTLSGGYQLRVLLAQVLFTEPHFLLLDEPTNYLDIFSIRWLEQYLIDYTGTLILSSHDRFFLNRVCQEIIDIDYGEMKVYLGNFDTYLVAKERDIEQKKSLLVTYEKKKKEMQRFVDRFRSKASKARQAQSRVRMIEKMEEEEKAYVVLPSSRLYPHFNFASCHPSGRLVLKVNQLEKSFEGKKVLHRISFEVEKAQKVAIVGANGAGKSTLLEILTENLTADQGSFRWGIKTKVGYFPQNFHRLLDTQVSLLDWLETRTHCHSEEKLRRALGAALFPDTARRKKIAALSGGEAARLVFASLALMEHNILILDEPTNHLDMESTDALIEALNQYQGTLLIVSHNRHFISEVADRILEIGESGVLEFTGGYQGFVDKHDRDHLDIGIKKNKPVSTSLEERKAQRQEKTRLKREIEKYEKKYVQVEKEIEAIDETLAAPQFYEKTPIEKQQKILNQKDRLEEEIASVVRKWEGAIERLDNTNPKMVKHKI